MQASNDSFLEETTNANLNLKNELSRYLSFYPYILISIIFGLLLSFTFLRYAELTYQTKAQIQIIDKAQDSEMALPTSMTIFNRSMVNLENEIGIIKSFDLNKSVIEKLNYNRVYQTKGDIKTSVNHHSEWIDDYDLTIKAEYDENAIRGTYEIEFLDKNMNIYHNNKVYYFNSFSTTEKENDLPFDLTIRNLISDDDRILKFVSLEKMTSKFIGNLNIDESGTVSDQLNLLLTYVNPVIATEYLNKLIIEFDLDGISDRQKGYERTIDFVESRSVILEKELEKIEDEKQKFKSSNNITDIVSDASVNITQLYNYDSEIFKLNSQKDLLKLLEETITVNNLELIPYNIGINNNQINDIINQYNISVSSREKYLKSGAGSNNPIIKNLDKEAENIIGNLKISISNYRKNIEIELENLSEKEEEFAEKYNQIPLNEKKLRAINRELEIKEALFLLLLQKKEEAAINFAVVKPSIKVIDFARINKSPISPNTVKTYSIVFLISLFLPLVFLFIYFSLDTKIHTREQLKSIFNDIPILSEVPFLRDDIEKNNFLQTSTRNNVIESFRMIATNLNYMNFNLKNDDTKIILVTSSIKGEGKTLISSNFANIISTRHHKTIILGCDLRNPQLHKYFNIDKNTAGLADFLYRNDVDYKDLILKHNNLDCIVSGTIPPNPIELLSSLKFKNLIDQLKLEYDYIVVDSAPCLLVSDTFEISKYATNTIYVVRSNFSDITLKDFIKENYDNKKLNNMNLVFNSVGNSASYGYKYGYQYGYKYGYKYSYNYGYGYGYSKD